MTPPKLRELIVWGHEPKTPVQEYFTKVFCGCENPDGSGGGVNAAYDGWHREWQQIDSNPLTPMLRFFSKYTGDERELLTITERFVRLMEALDEFGLCPTTDAPIPLALQAFYEQVMASHEVLAQAREAERAKDLL